MSRSYFEQDGKELAVELKKKLQLDSSSFETAAQVSDCNTIIEEDEPGDSPSTDQDTEAERAAAAAAEDAEDEANLTDVSSESTPLPPKLSEWIPHAHLLEDSFEASITYVGYDCEVYFHPDTKECT